MAIVLWSKDLNFPLRTVLFVALSVALFLNGSRVWFLGALSVFVVFLWLSFRRAFGILAFACSSVALLLMFLVNMVSLDGFSFGDSSNRIVATLGVLVTGNDSPQRGN